MIKIVDNSSPKELLDQLRAFESLEALYNRFPCIRQLFPKLESTFKDFTQLKKQAEILLIPDRFNEIFAPFGWIAYESMNLDAMTKAIDIESSKGTAAAEQFLAQHYDAETLKWGIMRFNGNREFQRRIRLTELAKEDYLAERYHACAPLLLSLMDGLVNDVSKHVGFFAKNSDMTAWDCIAAHETGLQTLSALMGKGRNITNEESINIPYRNGILHGRELAFDNRIVAAKCWAALFAVRDWAGAIAEGKKNPIPKAKTSWKELFQKLAENGRTRKLLDAWQPRAASEFDYLPHTGCPSQLPKETPEHAVAEFIDNWCKRRFGLMAESLLYFMETSKGKKAGRAKEDFGRIIPSSFTVLAVEDQAAAASQVVVELVFDSKTGAKKREVSVRAVFQDADNNPVIRGKLGGSWRIVQNSFSNVIYGDDI